ncbi:hypothetical protein P171DRAFT_449315 [Karstenula rhodostoma CBS 690.94]|uniref:Uncharacterized protein n=1 Tax=Karstenula rhodostoma CBS 690.94 TaxID=1392251 RepID=A0A9P4U6F8_9PLEO|nr:hypothetical protein P171DRAFT_449315 [Karstenula rhodostoma CBS 690.94]
MNSLTERSQDGHGSGKHFYSSRGEEPRRRYAEPEPVSRNHTVPPLSQVQLRMAREEQTEPRHEASERRSRFEAERMSDNPHPRYRNHDDVSPLGDGERVAGTHTSSLRFKQIRDASPHERARREAAEHYQARRDMAQRQRVLRGETESCPEGSRDRGISGLQRQGAVRRRPTGL